MKEKDRPISHLRKLLERLKSLFRPKQEAEDPYAYRTAPVKRPPGGRSGAAVAELDEKEAIDTKSGYPARKLPLL